MKLESLVEIDQWGNRAVVTTPHHAQVANEKSCPRCKSKKGEWCVYLNEEVLQYETAGKVRYEAHEART